MTIIIENGDILLIKSHKLSDGTTKRYYFGHSEIGVNDPKLYPGLVSIWPDSQTEPEELTRESEAHVFRCNAITYERKEVAKIAGYLRSGRPVYGDARAARSILPGSNSRSEDRLKKYYDRLMQYYNEENVKPGKIMNEMFCSEASVVCVQLAAMTVRQELSAEAALVAAKRNPLWIEANAKHTTPDDLLRILRRSINWKYVGDYLCQPVEGVDTPLASTVRLALGHYNQNIRSKWGLTTSRESSLAIGYLTFLASPEGMKTYGEEKLRYYLKEILGIYPAMGQKVIPLVDKDVQIRKLPSKSRLRECLLLGLRQMHKPQFMLD